MVLSYWRFNQKGNIGFTIIIYWHISIRYQILLTFYLGFEKNVIYKKTVYIFPTNTLFEKMKVYL